MEIIERILIDLGIAHALPVSGVGSLVAENYFRDERSQAFCDQVEPVVSPEQLLQLAAKHPSMSNKCP